MENMTKVKKENTKLEAIKEETVNSIPLQKHEIEKAKEIYGNLETIKRRAGELTIQRELLEKEIEFVKKQLEAEMNAYFKNEEKKAEFNKEIVKQYGGEGTIMLNEGCIIMR